MKKHEGLGFIVLVRRRFSLALASVHGTYYTAITHIQNQIDPFTRYTMPTIS